MKNNTITIFVFGFLVSLLAVPYTQAIDNGKECTIMSESGVFQEMITPSSFNERFAVSVGPDGRFNIGAFPDPLTGGATVESWNLTYRWPSEPWSSYTTFRIDGADNIYGDSGTMVQAPVDIDPYTNQSIWKVGDIEITQTLQIVFNNQTNEEDVAKISYEVKNTGSVDHEIGGRVMLDTDLNYNDGAPFRVPGDGIITTEKEYVGSAVPDTFTVYYDVTDNVHVAAATLKSSGATAPDRLVLARWGMISSSIYDYTVNPGYSFTSDSAYAVYWNPALLAPGALRTYTTFYGLAQLQADLTPPLALGVAAPATLSVVNNAYSPNPFTVTATVLNNGLVMAEDVTVTLNLPDELSFVSSSQVHNIGDLSVGQEQQVSWNIYATHQINEKILTYSVDVVATNTPVKNVPGQIILPSVFPDLSVISPIDVSIHHNNTLTSVTTPVIVDPINSVFGNYLHYSRDIKIPDRGLPLVFARTYNSHSQENGSLGHKWTHTYNVRLDEYSNGVVFVDSDGRWDFFELQADGSYQPTLDVLSTLQKNSDDTFSLSTRNKTIYHFNEEGKALSVVDANSNTLSFVYDANGNISEAIAPTGRTLVFATDIDGRIISITDQAGRIYTYLYDAEGNLASVTNPLDEITQYTYDENHNLVLIVDSNGHIVAENEYDIEDRVIRQTDGRGNAGTFLYDTDEQITIYTSAHGEEWKYYYDDLFRVTKQVDAVGNESLFSFNSNSRLIAWTDQNGYTTYYEYDGAGNLIRTTNALGNDRVSSYDSDNNLISANDELGNTTLFTYDAHKNLITVVNSLGTETVFMYDTYGQLTTVTDSLGEATIYVYDASGNLIKITDAIDGEVNFEYDATSSLTGRTDPNGSRVSMEYDLLNQLMKITNALGNSSMYDYDAVGNVVQATDAENTTTEYSYDENNNLIRVADAMGGVTQYGYDVLNNLVTITNADGNIVQYENNALNQVSRIIDPLGNSSMYEYDGTGNVTMVTTAEGNIVSYEYDLLNRLLRKSFSDGTYAQFSYDVTDNLIGAENQHVSYAYTYNSLGLVTSFEDSRFGATTYIYDVLGRRTQTTNENDNVQYEYDPLNRLANMRDGDNETFMFEYDPVGRRTALILPNEITTSYTYDDAGQLRSLIASPLRGADVFSENYNYDSRGNRSLKQGRQWQTTYEYDLLARLTQAYTQPNITNPKVPEHALKNFPQLRSENYEYDSVGNRVEGPQNESYTYDQADKLLSVNGSPSTSFIFSYDKNGNVIKKTGKKNWRYAYNDENQLIIAEQILNDKVVNKILYEYDPFGRRIQKKSYLSVEPPSEKLPSKFPLSLHEKTEQYLYEGEDIAVIYDEFGEMQMSFVHGPGIDEPLSVTYYEKQNLNKNKVKNETHYYIADALGSIVRLTDKKGHIVESFEYDSFGNFRTPQVHMKQPYAYTGREYDTETGLYYYRARYYDPSVGRFISKDPVAGFIEYPNSFNKYSYVYNNPIMYLDHTGEEPVTLTLVAGACGVGAIGGGAGNYVGDVIGNVRDPNVNSWSVLWPSTSWKGYGVSIGGGCGTGVATLFGGIWGAGIGSAGTTAAHDYVETGEVDVGNAVFNGVVGGFTVGILDVPRGVPGPVAHLKNFPTSARAIRLYQEEIVIIGFDITANTGYNLLAGK